MTYTILAISLAVLAVSLSLAIAAVRAHGLRHRRDRARAADAAADAALSHFYQSYVRTIQQESARSAALDLPDDEWLAAIRARAESRLRPGPQQQAFVGHPVYRPATWEIVEPASIGWAREW